MGCQETCISMWPKLAEWTAAVACSWGISSQARQSPWLPAISLQPVSSGRRICHGAWAAFLLTAGKYFSLPFPSTCPFTHRPPCLLGAAAQATPNFTNPIMKMAMGSVKIFRKPTPPPFLQTQVWRSEKWLQSTVPSLAITDSLPPAKETHPMQAPTGKTFCNETDVCPVTCLPRARL